MRTVTTAIGIHAFPFSRRAKTADGEWKMSMKSSQYGVRSALAGGAFGRSPGAGDTGGLVTGSIPGREGEPPAAVEHADQAPRRPDLDDVACGFITRGGVLGCGCVFGSGMTRMPAFLRLVEKSGMGACFFFIGTPAELCEEVNAAPSRRRDSACLRYLMCAVSRYVVLLSWRTSTTVPFSPNPMMDVFSGTCTRSTISPFRLITS